LVVSCVNHNHHPRRSRIVRSAAEKIIKINQSNEITSCPRHHHSSAFTGDFHVNLFRNPQIQEPHRIGKQDVPEPCIHPQFYARNCFCPITFDCFSHEKYTICAAVRPHVAIRANRQTNFDQGRQSLQGEIVPRNGMYWAGYLISKSYYENATDKKQAIYDLLHIQDYEAFFEKSRADRYINLLK